MSYTYAVLNGTTVIQVVSPPTGFNATSLVDAGVWIDISNTAVYGNVTVGDVYSSGTFSVPPSSYGSSPSITFSTVYGNGFVDTSTIVVSNTSSLISTIDNCVTFTVPTGCTTVVFDNTITNFLGINTISFAALNLTTGSQRILLTGYGPTAFSFLNYIGNCTLWVANETPSANPSTVPVQMTGSSINIGQGYYAEFLFVPTANVIIGLCANIFGG